MSRRKRSYRKLKSLKKKNLQALLNYEKKGKNLLQMGKTKEGLKCQRSSSLKTSFNKHMIRTKEFRS
jgi:hypothetical protein